MQENIVITLEILILRWLFFFGFVGGGGGNFNPLFELQEVHEYYCAGKDPSKSLCVTVFELVDYADGKVHKRYT